VRSESERTGYRSDPPRGLGAIPSGNETTASDNKGLVVVNTLVAEERRLSGDDAGDRWESTRVSNQPTGRGSEFPPKEVRSDTFDGRSRERAADRRTSRENSLRTAVPNVSDPRLKSWTSVSHLCDRPHDWTTGSMNCLGVGARGSRLVRLETRPHDSPIVKPIRQRRRRPDAGRRRVGCLGSERTGGRE
jgi:hypothetical protein